MSDLMVRGPLWGGTAAPSPLTASFSGAQRVTDAHGRFADACLAGRLYTFGLSNTALVAANAIATGLTSSAQPVIGIYNPPTSGVYVLIYQARIIITTLANSAVSPGGFMWVYSAGNNGVSTGSVPVNCKTLLAQGSAVKAFSVSTALTGLTNNLVAMRAFDCAPFNAAGAATAASIIQAGGTENVDGGIGVPPGGVIAVMNQVSTTTASVSTGIIWEEHPVLL